MIEIVIKHQPVEQTMHLHIAFSWLETHTSRLVQFWCSVRANKGETKLNRAAHYMNTKATFNTELSGRRWKIPWLPRTLAHTDFSHFVHCHQDLHNARYVVLRCSTFYFRSVRYHSSGTSFFTIQQFQHSSDTLTHKNCVVFVRVYSFWFLDNVLRHFVSQCRSYFFVPDSMTSFFCCLRDRKLAKQ